MFFYVLHHKLCFVFGIRVDNAFDTNLGFAFFALVKFEEILRLVVESHTSRADKRNILVVLLMKILSVFFLALLKVNVFILLKGDLVFVAKLGVFVNEP